MHLMVACIGQRMPAWVEQGWQEYARRMPRELQLRLREIPLAKRGRNPDLARIRRQESEALLAAVPAGAHRVALDIGGRPWSTEQLAQRMEHWQAGGRDCALLIGGPDGLDADCLDQVDERWSLGPLTLPHPLVRVIVAEQLYRAWTVLRGHPYHRA